jgi:hypothetical protein
MPRRPRPNVTLKVFRNTKEPWRHLLCNFDNKSIFSNLLAQIEAPQDARDIDEQRAFSNMYTRTYPSSGTICEVIPRLWIRCIDVVCRRRRVLEVAGGIESVGFGPKFRVAVNSPGRCSDLMLQAEL